MNSPNPTTRDSDLLLTSGRLLSTVIFTALLLLVVWTPIPYGTVEPPWIAAFEVVVFVLGALWLIDTLPARRVLAPEQYRLLLPLLAIAIYAFIQTLPFWPQAKQPGPASQAISSDPHETQLQAMKFLALTLALALLLQYTNSSRRLKLLLHAVIAIALASAVFGIVRQLYQFESQGFLLSSLQKASGYAQFINKNHFAFLCEMALGLLAGLIAGRGIAWPRPLVYVAIALPIWAAVVLSNSRAGILAMIAQLIFFVLVAGMGGVKESRSRATNTTAPRRVMKLVLKFALATALVVGIVIGVILVGGEPLTERFNEARNELSTQTIDTTHADRASIWKATLRLCYAHPITGTGFGGYWIAITRYHNASGELTPQQAHNDYLELWASGGLIGVALFIWFVVAFTKQAYVQLQNQDRFRRAVALGAVTGLFGVAVHSLLDFGLHITGNALVCLALITLATRQIKDANGRTHATPGQPPPLS